MKVLAVVFLCLFSLAFASSCAGTINTLPISTSEPVLINSTTNGKYFLQSSVDPPLAVVHLWGTPYEMGYAHGELMSEQINELITDVFVYVDNLVEEYLAFLPQEIVTIIEDVGVPGVMDWTWEQVEPYTPEHFKQEMKGMADGSGVPYRKIVQIHMIPEVIQAHCSMVGAWGAAISNTTGSLYQLRALDWDTDGPFQQFPQVTVYHPESDNGHAFSILSWSGFIGALTGYSSSSVGICEKVWLSYDGKDSRSGYPFIFLLRDILQYDLEIDDALNRINNAERTCSIFVGVGDNNINQMRIIEYAHEYANVGNDKNIPAWDGHPQLESVVYLDKHSQPSTDPCLGDLISKYYANLDAETMFQKITPVHQTGDLHIAVYDYAEDYMYVSNASPVPDNGDATQVVPAYDRSFIRLDMSAQFAESQN